MKYSLIDVAALIYSAKYAMPKLYADNQATGILYGFTRYILALQRQFNFDQFIFCFDSINSKRKELYPEYKAGRNNLDETRQLIYSQFDIIKNEILPGIGFKNLFEVDGLEADDIIGSLCKTKKSEDEYIIISRDHDLFQLLKENISQHDYISKKLITEQSFFEKYEIDPIEFGMVKAISGCKSDFVGGIQGIGEKTAIKYLNGFLKESSKKYQKIISDEGQKIINRNIPLVVLPFAETPAFNIVQDEISFEDLTKIFIKYDFASQLTNNSLNKWKKSFDWIDIPKTGSAKLSDFF